MENNKKGTQNIENNIYKIFHSFYMIGILDILQYKVLILFWFFALPHILDWLPDIKLLIKKEVHKDQSSIFTISQGRGKSPIIHL